jgi:branched-subunit amino acid aminotransferase/4-amino-4-deoxychorismate lyase
MAISGTFVHDAAAGEFRPADATHEADDPDRILAMDSWLLDEGCVRVLHRHRDRFMAACTEVTSCTEVTDRQGVAQAALPSADVLASAFDRAVAMLPPAGRWFPRIELQCDGSIVLRVRPCPPLTSDASVWSAVPDARRIPSVKGFDQRWSADVRARALAHGYDEALIVDGDGHLVEGVTTAVLWWRGDALCSVPSSVAAVRSVTQDVLIEAARLDGIVTREEVAAMEDLAGLEVWVVNALHGVRPVVRWSNGQVVGPAAHPPWARAALLAASERVVGQGP